MTDSQISNPFSTGGGGPRFECQVQAAFAILMLAGGYAPCLPCLPIKSIKLQARHNGCLIDDLVVTAESPNGTETHRLLVQVKHGIAFTKSNTLLSETLTAAWRDFNNVNAFTKDKDAIAIISGPLSSTDIEGARDILEWARAQSSEEFVKNIAQSNFSSDNKRNKLAAFRAHTDAAAGMKVNDKDTHEFLRHIHILSFDLDVRAGMIHALLHTIAGRFRRDYPASLFSEVFEYVCWSNQNAGILTIDKFPKNIRYAFRPPVVVTIPTTLSTFIPPPKVINWNSTNNAEALITACLLGGWNDKSTADMTRICELSLAEPKVWLKLIQEVLQHPESPLVHINGNWTVKNRMELWANLSPRVFNETVERFRACILTILKESNPKFDLDSDQRFAEPIYGKVLSHSSAIRSGIAEMLAILACSDVRLTNCALSTGQHTAIIVVRELFKDADWKLWGSLDRLLPTLAEAAPDTFLEAVEDTLKSQPCSFDELFSQEGKGTSGDNYITGLLWALETLAWDEVYLVRVSVILAALANRDPGGNYSNRPANSLTTIFLPWLPQTRGSIHKREVAVKTVVREYPIIGWRLLLSLLPNQTSSSMYTRKPKWRNKLDNDEDRKPTIQEYSEQLDLYAQIIFEAVQNDLDKLELLVDSLDKLPEWTINELLDLMKSPPITNLAEERRLPIWSTLSSFVQKHRQFADAPWALSLEIVNSIEFVAKTIVPQDPSLVNRIWFNNNTWDLHEDQQDWRKSEENIAQHQLAAIEKIYKNGGFMAVKSFAENVENSAQVGHTLGKLKSIDADAEILPTLILSSESKIRSFVRGFVQVKFRESHWSWFDALNLKDWSTEEISRVLTYLPFNSEAWTRAYKHLPDEGKDYWINVPIGGFELKDNDYIAVDALLKNGRPRAALVCLAKLVNQQQAIDSERAINALLAETKEPSLNHFTHDVASVIKVLQDDTASDKNKLLRIELLYLPLLEYSQVTQAKTWNAAIALEPERFCEIIRLIYKSDKDEVNQQKIEATVNKSIAENAYRILLNWTTIPGCLESGTLSSVSLNHWIDSVRRSLEHSGHLKLGLLKAGEVFIHAPIDPSGFFIHKSVAELLNRDDMKEFRRGYEIAILNSRGGHIVDPTGDPEKKLAQRYMDQAEQVENEGFHRLATTYRSVAEFYSQRAGQIIEDHTLEESAFLTV